MMSFTLFGEFEFKYGRYQLMNKRTEMVSDACVD